MKKHYLSIYFLSHFRLLNLSKHYAFCFLFSAFYFLPFCAFAQFGGGTGSAGNPYQISSVTHLEELATRVNGGNAYSGKYFILTADLDLNVAPFNSGTGWTPIGMTDMGSLNLPFSGNFNGNGKNISNLMINNLALATGAGLFGFIEESVIENLGMEKANITVGSFGGCVAGAVLRGAIKNCYFTGNISGGDVGIGGVAGCLYENCSITNCYSTGNVSGSNGVGGVAGYVFENCSITNSHSTGSVSGIMGTGGVAGVFGFGSITNCYSTGKVSGDYWVGGVAGSFMVGTITDCYSTGTVNGGRAVGGVAGEVEGNEYGGDIFPVSITNCYSTGNVIGTDDYVGGMAGSIQIHSSITSCYSTGAVSGNDKIGGIAGALSSFSKIEDCAALNPSVKGSAYVGRVTGLVDGFNTLTNNIAFEGILNKAGNTTWSDKGLTKPNGEDITKETINTNGTLGGRFTSPAWTTKKGSLPGLFGNTIVMPEHLRIPGMIYITTESLPNGKVGVFYSATLTADSDAPVSWSIFANVLPTGLTLNPNTCVISGIPTNAIPFTFIVKAANSAGNDTKELSITINNGVGIVETHNCASLRVYPNPTMGELRITNYELGITNIEIYDIYGKKLSSNHLITSSSNHLINISHFPAGVYFLRIQTETGTITQKIIKN